MREKIVEKIESMFQNAIDLFVGGLDIKQYSDEQQSEKFYSSKEFNEFKDNMLVEIVSGMKNFHLSSFEVNDLIKSYKVNFTDEEINKIISEDNPQKPTAPPPAGKKYILERSKDGKSQWVLVDA